MSLDYGDLKMNLEGMNKFFRDNGVKLNSKDTAKINTIFSECDVENTNGEEKPDGELTGQERTNFLDKIKTACPKLYQKVVDFYTAVEVVEDLRENKEIQNDSESIDK